MPLTRHPMPHRWAGINLERNAFLLVGNMLCIAGCVIFIMMIIDMEGNPNYIPVFGILALYNAYSTIQLIVRYR